MAVKKNEKTEVTTAQAAETGIPTDPAPEATASSTTEMKPDGCAAGFYCYIGPSIKGLIWHGDDLPWNAFRCAESCSCGD